MLTAGQRHESTQLQALPDGIWVPRPGGVGRPRKRPGWVTADRGYSYPTCRGLLRRRGIGHTILQRSDQHAQRQRKGRAGGRPPGFDRVRYRQRNQVERCFARLKHHRAIATRDDKHAINYRALIVIAATLMWLA